MSEYIKLTSTESMGHGAIFVKARQVSSISERMCRGDSGDCVQISMMGGSYYQVEESFEEVKNLLGIKDE